MPCPNAVLCSALNVSPSADPLLRVGCSKDNRGRAVSRSRPIAASFSTVESVAAAALADHGIDFYTRSAARRTAVRPAKGNQQTARRSVAASGNTLLSYFRDLEESRALRCLSCQAILWVSDIPSDPRKIARLVAEHVEACEQAKAKLQASLPVQQGQVVTSSSVRGGHSGRKRLRCNSPESIASPRATSAFQKLGLDPTRCTMVSTLRPAVDCTPVAPDLARRMSQAVVQQSVGTPVFSQTWLRF